MPYRRQPVRRRMRGRGLREIVSKIGGFLRKHKIISRGGAALGSMLPGAWGTAARSVGSVAGKLGYGRRMRRYRGSGLKLAGM